MYFRSKQDIAMSKFSEGADRLTEAMRERSPDERAVDVLGRWLLAEHESGDDEMVELERRMFVANPELAALRTARMDAAIRESTRVVAEDLGVAPETVGPSSPSRTAAHHTARTPHRPRRAALQLTRATPTGRTTGRRQRTPPPPVPPALLPLVDSRARGHTPDPAHTPPRVPPRLRDPRGPGAPTPGDRSRFRTRGAPLLKVRRAGVRCQCRGRQPSPLRDASPGPKGGGRCPHARSPSLRPGGAPFAATGRNPKDTRR
ncbi:hypothetical protein SAMN05216489_07190 [Streptomyces sp. 3213]|nr:hypothetical protein SAMN05216489_07190 [Streptomyces sp. 3213] [Streptomyces sp. 3213.3]